MKSSLITAFFAFIGLLFVYSCSTPDPDFNVERDIENGKFYIITYGLELTTPRDMKIKKQLDSLRSKYGFEYENRGCMVDSQTLIKAKVYNKRVIEFLSTRNGINWFAQYQKSVDSLRNMNKDTSGS